MHQFLIHIFLNVVVPQFNSANVTLVANSSSCLQMLWEAPEYPGGVITRYEVQKNHCLIIVAFAAC